MKATIEDLKNSFKVGYEAYEASRKEANEVWDLYHNRQYTPEQLAVLNSRGQPAETFNVIKLFARMLVGYYSTIVNQVIATAVNPRDTDAAAVLNDVLVHIFEDNRFDIEGDQIKLGGLVSGLLCCYNNVEFTGERDQFNRPINRVRFYHVPDNELVLDPNSQMDDYSDAEYLHRFKWLSKTKILRTFGQSALDKLTSYYNFLQVDEAEYEFNYGEEWTGSYRIFDNYLVVHTVLEDDNGDRWSCFWHDDVMLLKERITYKTARWPYRIQKLHSSNLVEYYGVFREIIESQKSMNQAVLKIHLMINSEKAFVQEGAVEDLNEFTTAFNRVNSVIPVLNLNGIKIEKLSKEIQDQYGILDRALDRIQRILGINDSFLGMAFASDSGRKVKLQQSATIMSLRYITARIESFYRSLGEDITALVQQYYTANQILPIVDEVAGERYVELNRPMLQFTGQFDETGQPIYEPILLPYTNPASGEIEEDEQGNIILAPVAEEGTELGFAKFKIRIESTAYNDEDEKAQLLLETMMSGQIGQMVAQVNPAGFFQMASLSVKSTKTKFSPNIADILANTAQMLQQNPAANEQAALNAMGGGAGAPKSRALKLPTNTNEGVE